jgi:hypothetical protein
VTVAAAETAWAARIAVQAKPKLADADHGRWYVPTLNSAAVVVATHGPGTGHRDGGDLAS